MKYPFIHSKKSAGLPFFKKSLQGGGELLYFDINDPDNFGVEYPDGARHVVTRQSSPDAVKAYEMEARS